MLVFSHLPTANSLWLLHSAAVGVGEAKVWLLAAFMPGGYSASGMKQYLCGQFCAASSPNHSSAAKNLASPPLANG